MEVVEKSKVRRKVCVRRSSTASKHVQVRLAGGQRL